MSVIDDAALLKMAEAEILREAKRAAIRHSIAGVSGWQPCPKPNKIFLTNTLLQTVASNKHLAKKKGKNQKPEKNERKLLQRKNKMDMTSNFIYQKPRNQRENSSQSARDNKHSSSNNKAVDIQLESKKEFKKFSKNKKN